MKKFDQEKARELAEQDDWSSAWEECKKLGVKWGGRGRGGRATGRMTVQTKDVVVEGCTMTFAGNDLLDRTTLRLLNGRRYGLIGRNGVGKSSLLNRIVTGTLPGFPPHIRVAEVQQELPSFDDDLAISPVDFVLSNLTYRNDIMDKISCLETCDCDDPDVDVEEIAQMLESLYDLVEDEGVLLSRIITVLKSLGFSESRRAASMASLSGGWRMRALIASALVQEPDILLLDEPTNHLDVEGVIWLTAYLKSPAAKELTVLCVSHDRHFLDDVCTDMILFKSKHLQYYSGNYSEYEREKKERETSSAKTQDHLDKQRNHMEDSVRKMQTVAAKSDSSTGMVASRKKKLERLGKDKNVHGHRFRAQHEATAGRSAAREGSQCDVAMGTKTGNHNSLLSRGDQASKMTIPSPQAPPSTQGPLISIRGVGVGYYSGLPPPPAPAPPAPAPPSSSSSTSSSSFAPPTAPGIGLSLPKKRAVLKKVGGGLWEGFSHEFMTIILGNLQLDIEQSSKIAILGSNGSGKSTLIRLLIDTEAGTTTEGLVSHPLPQSDNAGLEGIDTSTSTTTEEVDGAGAVEQEQTGQGKGEPKQTVSQDQLLVMTQGEIIKKRNGLRIAYYHQQLHENLPYDATALSYLTSLAPEEMRKSEQLVRAHLGSFQLSGDIVNRQIGTMSGGQKSRLVLAVLTIHRPNLLLLDEPTNNLDLDAVRALEQALKEYSGAVLLTSHDLSFVEAVVDEGSVYMLEKVAIENVGGIGGVGGRGGGGVGGGGATKKKCAVLKRLEGGVGEYRKNVHDIVANQRRRVMQ